MLTSNFYSILYYNSEVWHLNSLKYVLKISLLSVSAKAIRVAFHYPDSFISYVKLHEMANRATPKMFNEYKLVLLLFKTFNNQLPEANWLALNFDQINTGRQTEFFVYKSFKLLVGLNIPNN